MADEERTTNGDGFDDWLEEEPGPDTDPYAALNADDDAEAEIAEWMAFTGGEPAAEVTADAASPDGDGAVADATAAGDGGASASVPADDEPTEELIIPSPAGDDVGDAEAGEPTDDRDEGMSAGSLEESSTDDVEHAAEQDAEEASGEAASFEPATSVELDEFDGGGRPDTEEIPIITAADVAAPADAGVAVASATAAPGDDDAGRDDQDETGGAGDVAASATAASGDDGEAETAGGDDSAAETAASDDDDETVDAGDAVAAVAAAPGQDEDAPADDGDADAGARAGEAVTLDEEGDDTGEMPVVPIAPADVEDDTGELDPVPGGLASGAAAATVFDHDAADTGEQPSQPFDLSQDDYFSTATREHAGLAAAIAEAETEETEQVALAAPIPGLETTVVGFEDVVEAEGHTKARARASGDLLARVVTGVILIAAVGVSLFYRPALVALATVVFVIGAGEFYTALRRSGRQPISLFGFLGILGASLGAFIWGAVAIPVSFLLVAALLLLFYAVVPGKPEPMANLALTVTVMVWAGLGTYAMMIIDSDDFRPLVIGVVLTVAFMDIAQYFVGRGLGRHQLSPWVSPKKTVEGLIGGVIVALTLGALLHFVPPFELTSGLAVGAAVAVLSPLGDLAMSAAKRALGIKDMGSILPGHGGFLDRIDGLLFVIPAVWAIFVWAGLI